MKTFPVADNAIHKFSVIKTDRGDSGKAPKTVKPEISVVMSVYNGASRLAESVESILDQKGVELEFVIVDDGSTDESLSIVEKYAACDGRIRIIRQENKGLTKALIRGCAEARGEFIARQDAGDVSLQNRLAKELDLIREDSSIAFVSCGTRFVGPGGEFLFDVLQNQQEADAGLQASDLKNLRGPSCHPCTLFRKSSYLDAGGYRPHFRMAQDIDLWIRLCEKGRHMVVPEILYQAEYSLDGVSSGGWRRQQKYGLLILESAKMRRAGRSEESVLAKAEKLSGTPRRRGFVRRSKAAYFVGSCLLPKDRDAGVKYLKQSIKANPLNIKALSRYVLARLFSR